MKLNHTHFNTRAGMVSVFEDGAPTPAIARGIRVGNIRLLGRFMGEGVAGWVAVCRTVSGDRDRILMLSVDDINRTHAVREIPHVPWKYWEGRGDIVGWSALGGDNANGNFIQHLQARFADDLAENAVESPLSDINERRMGGVNTTPGVTPAPMRKLKMWERVVDWLWGVEP